jgi:predicted TIM-barrel fold metal-dependent hydrolase
VKVEIRHDVLAKVQEEILEPDRPIIDTHHHFFDEIELFPSYSLEDLWADTSTHNVQQTVFMECTEHYRKSGPAQLAPVGETEWVAGIAAEAARGPVGASRVSAIVGTADVMLGDAVQEVLEAQLEASPLFRGIRFTAAWAEGEGVHRASPTGDALLYDDATFRSGFAKLAPLGLSFDGYHYHTQTRTMASLARAFPGTTIVVDHLSTPLGIGSFAGKREEVFEAWAKDMSYLAGCPNVNVKLGGMAMPWNGFGWDEAASPPSSDDFVAAQGRYYHHAIEAFGPDRCMFESNFPVDKLSLSYAVLWNAFKKIAARYSEDEKQSLFQGTAMRVYRIDALG